jgi:hypothetical protein
MFSKIFGSIAAGIMSLGGLFSHATSTPPVAATSTMPVAPAAVERSITIESSSKIPTTSPALAMKISSKTQKVLSDAELVAMAGTDFVDGKLPLGDGKYVTSGPKKGYIYLCNVRTDSTQGAGTDGPWITGTTWNIDQKVSVQGSVSWPNASFSDTIASGMRTLAGNDLPINHTTGTYPITSSDPASAYDRNPNSIKVQTIRASLPANPQYSDTPYCMGGEVGIMLSGVALFNGFDAQNRDAAAHEVQDSCDGHPQEAGEYHYHSLSSCFKDTGVETVLGFAYDGFPITGPMVANGRYLTTADLDECHGITSRVILDGKKTITYHYVMTEDFPYSASCFRGKPVMNGPSVKGQSQNGAPGQMNGQGQMRGGQNQMGQLPQPPQAAFDACVGKNSGKSCFMNTPNGQLTGMCRVPPNLTALACVPQ